MYILGVRIDNFSKKEILDKVEFFLSEDKFHQIATVNPEFILEAHKKETFKNIINSCELNVADGIGIWFAFIRHFKYLKCRFAGADLVEEVLKIANERELRVYLAVNKNGLSSYSDIKKVLEKKYPKVHFGGRNFEDIENDFKMVNSDYEIFLCNFGAPFQEIFLNCQKNGRIRLAMGVGGSFDFITGRVKRAPKLMRILGLEWLWRMFFHPSNNWKYLYKRVIRIMSATLIFPIRVIINR